MSAYPEHLTGVYSDETLACLEPGELELLAMWTAPTQAAIHAGSSQKCSPA